MKMTAVYSYIQSSGPAFQHWCDEEADRFISTQIYLQICFILISLNNAVKGGGFWYLFPAIFILLLGYFLVKLEITKRFACSTWIWDLSSACALASAVAMHRNLVDLNIPLTNAPILVACLFISMLNLRSTLVSLVIRNLILLFVVLANTFLILNVVDAKFSLIQIFEGFMGGTFVAAFLLHSKQIRFLHVHSNVEQRFFAYQELSKIVPTHVVRHIENGKTLETSMQIGFANACVISFDIIGSSKITHPLFHQAVEKVMALCYEKMMLNYDPSILCANAYRIKDVGDGFLCSVGFPYHLPPRQSAPNLAVELTLQFMEIFQTEMDQLRYETPICCSIGIAQGMVEGFFPSSGLKQYDLRGRTLVLAKRYESLRNRLILLGETACSFIILQEAVFHNLSLEKRSLFQYYDTSAPELAIRDDNTAKAAYIHRWSAIETDELTSRNRAS